MDDWLIPTLSLQTELSQERARRAAARMGRDQLAVVADEMIQKWFLQQELINRLLGRVRELEVMVALKDAPPFGPPRAEHHQWAAELLGRDGIA
jgi:hypothetical protein